MGRFNRLLIRSFQSTHPVWGGTRRLLCCRLYCRFQSTHPVWGGTIPGEGQRFGGEFQSTHPVRGGTDVLHQADNCGLISIHPPRAGWDVPAPLHQAVAPIFQSTHPVRGGTDFLPASSELVQFQSTHPVRGGTAANRSPGSAGKISIHPPRAGWD